MRQEQLQERKSISVKLVKYHSHSVPMTFQWWNLTDFVTRKRCKYDCRYWEHYGNVVPHLQYGLLVHLQKARSAFLLFFVFCFYFCGSGGRVRCRGHRRRLWGLVMLQATFTEDKGQEDLLQFPQTGSKKQRAWWGCIYQARWASLANQEHIEGLF